MSCSSQKNSPLNKAFHNTTAHFNAYYIGLERIKEVEADLWHNLKPDYNHVLPIFPPLDSTMATTYKTQLEDCIKKASMVIQYHQNSKWVDDSYNLIGLARMYGYDFPNAITTFKYVNTNGKDINAKHEAIISLMHTFIEAHEYANAEAASNFLEQERLNKSNLRQLYLTRAYYYQKINDLDNLVRNLVLADPLLKTKEKARYFFIIGQVYQELDFKSAAYQYYKKCVGSNPEYELSFYAKLNMAQVTQLSDRRSIKDVRKYFRKLVKDEKNLEFKDRIYYELALFELKQRNMNEAIDNLKLSITNSLNNPLQKGMSYLKLGQILFDSLQDYRTAQAYYDSAVTTLPTTYENYKSVKQRTEVLNDFINQITVIELQDSLLQLATMDSTTLIGLFTGIAQSNVVSAKEVEKEKKKRSNVGKATSFVPEQPTGVGNSTWYFDNPSAVASGRASFIQIWGNRILEDHWRRSIKQAAETNNSAAVTDTIASAGVPDQSKPAVNDSVLVANDVKKMYGQVPRTKADKDKSLKLLEDAYYHLGKIYYFDLDEKQNAVITFSKLIEQFSASEYLPEVYYLSYLNYEESSNPKSVKISEIMHDRYSTSIYTKLIDNPNYQEQSSEANEKLARIYEKAYNYFEAQQFDSARNQINVGMSKYAGYSFITNLELLNILITGKLGSLADYQLELQKFIKNNPDNKLTPYAQTLLDASKNYRESLVKLKEAEYSKADLKPYFFVTSLSEEDTTDIDKKLHQFIGQYFSGSSLRLDTLSLNKRTKMHIIRSFESKEDVLLFYDTFKAQQPLKGVKNDSFVITKLNFDTLFTSKELATYLLFFNDNF